jgi:hypothetical protein
MRKAWWLVPGLIALGGCGGGITIPDEPASVYVKVLNHRGNALRPDRVVWYYPPESSRYDGGHEATCLNDGCTVWGVPVEVAGDVYVSASRSRPYGDDPMCFYLGYDAKPTIAAADDPPIVTLRLDMRTRACA